MNKHFEHTESCKEYRDKVAAAILAYDREYPNYCRRCFGAGEIVYTYDPSPAGVSLGSGYMIDSEPCGGCVEKNICPRCGREVKEWKVENTTDCELCPHCNWQFGHGDERPLDVIECGCFDKWLDEQELRSV